MPEDLTRLFEAVFTRYGWDFRAYSPAALKRRVDRHLQHEGLGSTAELEARVLADPVAMNRLFGALTIHVSAMFRDPSFFRIFREQVTPLLATYPYLRLWVAGCASGEEAYSLAIVLHECNLLERARIYATDINDRILEQARAGIYPLAQMREYTRNYQAAGGQTSFGDYYTADSAHAVLRPLLRRHLVFAAHNLVGDASFNEFHVIFCRNVMIYFTRALQGRVHRLFYQSLLTFGYLGLGRSENIRFSHHEADYEPVAAPHRLYRKIR
jgi:chemotaxis protein methyltransferase CheR